MSWHSGGGGGSGDSGGGGGGGHGGGGGSGERGWGRRKFDRISVKCPSIIPSVIRKSNVKVFVLTTLYINDYHECY